MCGDTLVMSTNRVATALLFMAFLTPGFIAEPLLHAEQLVVTKSGQLPCMLPGTQDPAVESFTETLTLDKSALLFDDFVNGSYVLTFSGPCIIGFATETNGVPFIIFTSFDSVLPQNFGLDGWSVTDNTGTHSYSGDEFIPCHGVTNSFSCTFIWHPECIITNGVPFPTPFQVGISGYSASATLTESDDNTTDLGHCKQCEATAGSPINLTNGNTWITNQDYSLPGLGGGLGLVRTWNSLWTSQVPFETSGMFGDSWQSNYERRLQVSSGRSTSSSSSSQIKYWRGDGSAWTFSQNPSNLAYSVISPPDERALLTFDTTTNLFTLALQDGRQEIFDSGGYLSSLTDRNGNRTTLSYDSSQRLIGVTDAASRTLTFNYSGSSPSLVSSIQDAVRVIATYTYDAGGHLTRVTYADGSSVIYAYDVSGLITSSTDNNGKVFEAHTYDTFRRGLTSQRANGADAISISYQNGAATLQDSAGHSSRYNSGKIGGRSFVTSIAGPGCASCGGRGNYSYLYDSAGNRTSSTDPLGHTTTYKYDGFGNVVSRTSQLADGTKQTWSYTFNAFSQMTSSTDPLGHTTIFTYDSHGNLTSVVSPPPQ